MRAVRGEWHRAARRRVVAACLAALACSTCFTCLMTQAHAAASAPGGDAISRAERLLFTTDHLHGLAQQTELDYTLVSADPSARGTDTVKVLVTSPDNAKGDAQVSDHSGAVSLPNGNLQCNPVIIYFLERDIAEMEHLTGGQRRYFQRRLRLALAAGPKIQTVTSQVDGKPVKAQQIVVQPYLDDPNAERFAQYTAKRYTFLMAATVPGQVALIRTDVPGANNDFAHPLQSRTLSFQSMLHKLPPASAPGSPSAPAAPGKSSNAPRASR
ncbi:hypothetical protein VOM14_03210 [Paraburkholderia sp. MPAMCS5]|uniref:hypothetical protein n=1 Tax=Paraburkholderia sp. MPAMCS5 TaxID=3112563 RepID=UPI002E190206|nr:hypothetical protein [Paraburkholderia sp. MPAMCS5]